MKPRTSTLLWLLLLALLALAADLLTFVPFKLLTLGRYRWPWRWTVGDWIMSKSNPSTSTKFYL